MAWKMGSIKQQRTTNIAERGALDGNDLITKLIPYLLSRECCVGNAVEHAKS